MNVYDTTNISAAINMYGPYEIDTGLLHISSLDFGDPARKHEMRCRLYILQSLLLLFHKYQSIQSHLSFIFFNRFKQRPSLPWTAILASSGLLTITFLLGHIFYAAINRIDAVEHDCRKMKELKHLAEAADIAKSQVQLQIFFISAFFFVSHDCVIDLDLINNLSFVVSCNGIT